MNVKIVSKEELMKLYPEKQMPPGRELDALIAEKVMGAKHNAGGMFVYSNAKGELEIDPLAYSTDIAHAWEVVEKLNLLEENQMWHDKNLYKIGVQDMYTGQESVCSSSSAAHAICLAALKALNIPTPLAK